MSAAEHLDPHPGRAAPVGRNHGGVHSTHTMPRRSQALKGLAYVSPTPALGNRTGGGEAQPLPIWPGLGTLARGLGPVLSVTCRHGPVHQGSRLGLSAGAHRPRPDRRREREAGRQTAETGE